MIATKDSSKFDYLRHRPFLVIEMLSTPTAGVHTERKGWMLDTGNIQTTEHPAIVDRISPTTMRCATVIIDIMRDCVIKNRLRAEAIAFDDEVLARYKRNCAGIIESAKQRWSMR